MSISPINTQSTSYVQSILSSALQQASSRTNKHNNSPSGIDASPVAQPDNSQLSPFAQMLSTLQQLQQSDPTKYYQVTQQIATNLQSAAQTAQADGNATAANQLNQLATDFTQASSSGQLPNIQDLAQAIGGHHHHHRQTGGGGGGRYVVPFNSGSGNSDGKMVLPGPPQPWQPQSTAAATSDSSANSSSSSTLSGRASQMLSQLLSAFQANGAQSAALDPMSIISNTLSSAGINGSNG